MAKVAPDQTVYVYGLHTETDPTIMYVGCSVNPEKRRRQHVGEANLASSRGYHVRPLHAWIVSCVARVEDIALSILETCQAVDAPQSETKWINNIRSTNPSLLNEKRAPAYCSHLNTIADWLEPVRDASPGDTVFQIRKAYTSGRDADETIVAQVIKTSQYSDILIGGLLDGSYKQRWVSKYRLYQPKETNQ